MNRLKQLIETRRTKARMNMESELKAQFAVVERGDALWLTHFGVAFMEVPSGKTASEVAAMLNEARLSAITFERL